MTVGRATAATWSAGNQPSPDAPRISGTPATSVIAGNSYEFTPTASDPNGDTLRFAISKLPSWARFDTATGRLYGQPAAGNVGRTSGIQITVTDGTYRTALPKFSLTVQRGSAPVISGTPATSVVVETAYAFQPSARDADGQALAFSIAGKPTWASFNTATGLLAGTPGPGSAGTYANVVISVTDGASTASLPAFSITVKAGNAAPTIGGSPAVSVQASKAYDFRPTASDPDGDALRYSIVNRPGWAAFDQATGRLSGTPAAIDVASYADIVISVSDGSLISFLAPFTITVTEPPPNNPPTISGSPSTSVTVSQSYSFTPAASDADGQALTFSIANRPGWASFSTSTGRLSGTPASANVGTYSNIVISVSDGTASTALPAFSITVASQPNNPPTITGTPPNSAQAGQPYSFAPSASDPDGQTLRFSIAGKPAWASFDTTTGALAGTPGDLDAGTYSGITISVSDGTASTSLAPFTVTVTAATQGWATLRWSPPTQNVDGTPLTNLAGYRIRYGQSADALSSVLEVAAPSVTSATIEGLGTGTWYFAVKAYTAANVESDLSNIASKTIL